VTGATVKTAVEIRIEGVTAAKLVFPLLFGF
jgi:hypothetical protein